MRFCKRAITILIVLNSLATPVEASGVTSHTTVFDHVAVVTMADANVLQDQTVVVRDGRIVSITPAGETPPQKGGKVIDGRGRFLAPGLADMHTHIDDPLDFPLLLANGVTTTLNMGGASSAYVHALRAGIRSGRILGPDPMLGLLVDGPGDAGGKGLVPKSTDEARRVVDNAKAEGYDYIKVYSRLQPDMFEAIMDEASRIGIPVIGHVVRSVGLEKSFARGQVMVAHAEEYLTVFDDDDHPDFARIPELVQLTSKYKVVVTANLMGIDNIAAQWGKGDALVEGLLTTPEALRMRPELRARWRAKGYSRMAGTYNAQATFATALVKALHAAGVPILAGTDAPDIVGSVPGYSLHDEIELLARIGFGNYDALATATRVPGEFVARTLKYPVRFGVVAAGNRADLLLLEGNPLDDLTVLRHPVGVMVRGTWVPAAKLQSLRDGPMRAYRAAESTSDRFLKRVDDVGAPTAIKQFRAQLAKPEPLRVPDVLVNRAGYKARKAGRKEDAEALFRFETELYPLSWNAFDSLAETQASLGKKTEAVRAYRRAYELNPKNGNYVAFPSTDPPR